MNLKKIIVPVLILSGTMLLGCYGGNNPITEKQEKKEVSNLLSYYINKELKRDSIYLFNKSPVLLTELCVNNIVSENKDLGLTTDEILSKSQKDTIVWSNEIIPSAYIVSDKDITKFNNSAERVKKGQFFYLSNPIFSKDYKYAILHSEFVCGSRCGEGSTQLFKKENDNWRLLKTYCKTVN
ncbi:hypothetical protein [Pedobacter cryoconitis]|uniref:Lipoprotein n=1 Tax=Pedobacter cryoconitis TaxID=188932 RepID=A0A7X0J842_9SPHI|nr:hypothetical protein [Pedobacter cryoconitis]MBB6502813.1 hypothetical protein [Pedobacter cryoconitis]